MYHHSEHFNRADQTIGFIEHEGNTVWYLSKDGEVIIWRTLSELLDRSQDRIDCSELVFDLMFDELEADRISLEFNSLKKYLSNFSMSLKF